MLAFTVFLLQVAITKKGINPVFVKGVVDWTRKTCYTYIYKEREVFTHIPFSLFSANPLNVLSYSFFRSIVPNKHFHEGGNTMKENLKKYFMRDKTTIAQDEEKKAKTAEEKK